MWPEPRHIFFPRDRVRVPLARIISKDGPLINHRQKGDTGKILREKSCYCCPSYLYLTNSSSGPFRSQGHPLWMTTYILYAPTTPGSWVLFFWIDKKRRWSKFISFPIMSYTFCQESKWCIDNSKSIKYSILYKTYNTIFY